MTGDKIITGWWDGLPIWRKKTARETLLEAVIQNENERKELKDKPKE